MAATTIAAIGAGAAIKSGADAKSAASKSRRDARAQSEENRQALEQAGKQAREESLKLFPAAQENRLAGFGGALQAIENFTVPQFQAFQQGNLQAQGLIGQGGQAQQNALLGNPVDFSQFQPQSVTPDPSFLRQGLPEFTSTETALDPFLRDDAGNPMGKIIDGQFFDLDQLRGPDGEILQSVDERVFQQLPDHLQAGFGNFHIAPNVRPALDMTNIPVTTQLNNIFSPPPSQQTGAFTPNIAGLTGLTSNESMNNFNQQMDEAIAARLAGQVSPGTIQPAGSVVPDTIPIPALMGQQPGLPQRAAPVQPHRGLGAGTLPADARALIDAQVQAELAAFGGQ